MWSKLLSQVRYLWSLRYKHNRDFYAWNRAAAEGLRAGMARAQAGPAPLANNPPDDTPIPLIVILSYLVLTMEDELDERDAEQPVTS